MIYSTTVRDIPVIYRCPSRTELGHFRLFAKGNFLEFYERIVTACVLEPKISFGQKTENSEYLHIAENPYLPGDLVTLAKTILNETGYSNGKKLQEHVSKAEAYLNTIQGKYDALVLAAIPGVNPVMLWGMEPSELYKTYVMANLIAANIGIDPRKFTDPEAYMKDIEKAQRTARLQNSMADAKNMMYSSMKKNPNSEMRTEASQSFSID
jgi:hypothetical protein